MMMKKITDRTDVPHTAIIMTISKQKYSHFHTYVQPTNQVTNLSNDVEQKNIV